MLKTMRFPIILLLCVLCFGLGPKTGFSAQETPSAPSPSPPPSTTLPPIVTDTPRATELTNMITPLIDDQVVLIVHLNLQELDFDLLLEKTLLFVENSLKSVTPPPGQSIDARALTRIRINFQSQFDYMFREFREIRDRMIHEAGINDLFLIVYRDMTSLTPIVVVSPQKDKTPEQRKAFARIVRGAFPILFSEHGFMVCAAPVQMGQKEEADQKLREKLKNLKPSDTAYLKKAFAQQEGSAATIIGVIPPKTSEYLATLPKTSVPEVFLKLGIFISERVKWISAGLNIKDSSIKIIGQTTSNAEAALIVTAIKRASDNSLDDMLKQAEADAAADPNRPKLTPELKAKATENFKKLQAEYLPVVYNDNQLLLYLDAATKPQVLGLALRPLVLGFSASQQTIWGNQCSLNMRTLVGAFKKYAEEKGTYPPAWTVDGEGKPLHSWRVLILPYLDEEELFQSIKLDEPWDSEHNRQLHARMPTIFRCPASRFASNATTTYSLIVGPDAYPSGPETLKPDEVTDDPNSTILFVERKNPICWMKPEEISEENALKGIDVDRGIGSDHLRGGANVAFFDAAIRFVSNNAPLDALKKIITYRGGEEISLP